MLLRFDHFILLHFFFVWTSELFGFILLMFLCSVLYFVSLFLVFPGIPAAPGMPCPGEDREYYSHFQKLLQFE